MHGLVGRLPGRVVSEEGEEPLGEGSRLAFRSEAFFVLRDGQSSQLTVATDPVSGDVVKVDVTLDVVK
jgi:hypothetical protein